MPSGRIEVQTGVQLHLTRPIEPGTLMAAMASLAGRAKVDR